MNARPLALFAWLCVLLTGASVCLGADGDVSAEAAARVARNWIDAVSEIRGGWAGAEAEGIRDTGLLTRDDRVLGRLFEVSPRGYVLVPVRRELSPISAYSETSDPPGESAPGYLDFLCATLEDRIAALDLRGEGGVHPAWAELDLPADVFDTRPAPRDNEIVGPLLTSRWHQDWPFNSLCPMGYDARTYVGCTGLALSQILRYHEWPMRGYGSVSYWWDGDADCGNDSPGDSISVNFMVPHDWSWMPDEVNWNNSDEEQYAVAELCFHVAAALQTDFSTCGSSASLSRANSALVNYFNYQYGAREQPRFRYSDAAWFAMIQGEIDADRPTLYSSTIHTMVCDGWSEIDGVQMVHINYGWCGESDGWYALDSIETSLNPYAERMVTGIKPGDTIQTLVPELEVKRTRTGVKLEWKLDTLDPETGFHVWRGPELTEFEQFTTDALTGGTGYEWRDPDNPQTGVYYKLEMLVDGLPSIWIGPEWLAAVPVDPDIVVPSVEPNPFNPRVTIRFGLPDEAAVRADVFDLAGRRMTTLVDARLSAGPRSLAWNGRDASGRPLASGRYLLRLSVDGAVSVSKLILAK